MIRPVEEDHGFVTKFLSPEEIFESQYGTVRADDWLTRERARLEANGIRATVEVGGGGLMVLKKEA